MKQGLLVALGLWLSCTFALNYGDNFMYPKLTRNAKDYYEVNYCQAYFSVSGNYRLYDSLKLAYNLTDDFILSAQKKYLTGKLTMGLQYSQYMGLDLGELGFGIRNLGMSYADTQSPFGQEYLVYTLKYPATHLHLGLQRLIMKEDSIFGFFGGLEGQILDHGTYHLFYEYNYIGLGLTFPWTDQINLSLTAYGLATGSTPGDFKALELGVTIYNGAKSEKARSQPVNYSNKVASEVLFKLHEQSKQLGDIAAKVNAVEYLYSERFQQRFIDELVRQRLLDEKVREGQTMLLKTTMKHIQKGLEYFYLHDYERAFKEYQLANSLYPNMPLIHESLGSIYYQMGKFEQAKTEWLLAVSLDPLNTACPGFLGKLAAEHPELFDKGITK